MAVTVGPLPIGQQCQSLTGVATQIPGSPQSHGFQEEEREQLTAQCGWLMVGKTQRWINGEVAYGERCLKLCGQACLMSRGKQQETASTFLPSWLRGRRFLSRLFFSSAGLA
jgi:hypothetical protein